ncbi:MAG: hypothetical protein CL878_08245 [Dehalococcoidia bacterium]|nr:hypothetical protein [Dehalococcoidia bacterium]
MAAIRDRLWLWGTTVNALDYYGFATSKLSVAEGLDILGLPRAMMCGNLPPTEEDYAPVAHCRELLWQTSFDEGFAFERPLAPIVGLHQAHPNVTGVLLDDFSTTEIGRGATPDVLAQMRRAMPSSLQLWAVIYSMSLDIPNLAEYLEHLDGISFWVWHGRDLPTVAEQVERCRALSGDKPLILGLYFYNFGERQPLTNEEMKGQLETGLQLVRVGSCRGLCFLSSSIMDVGLEAVDWTRQWIAKHGDDPL